MCAHGHIYPAGRAGTSAFTSSTGRFRPITVPPAVPDLTKYNGVTSPK